MADENTEATQEGNDGDSQATEDVGLDLDAILEADYDRIQEGKPRVEETADTADKEPQGQEDGESDKTAQADDDKTEEPKETEDQDVDANKDKDEPATVEAPDSWTSDAKDKFKEADPVIQEEILKREKDFLAGHEKSEEARQLAKEFKETVSPYEAIIKSEGGTPMRAIGDLLNMGYVLRQGTPEQKTQLILNTAKRFNVDLGQVDKAVDDDEYVDPQIAELQKQVTSLQNQNQNQLHQDQQKRNDNAFQIVEAFKNEKDKAGNLLYPHFDVVKDVMGALYTAGRATEMKDAYEQAIWGDPKLRAELLKSERTESDKTKLEETKKKAAIAKKTAGTQVKSDGGNVAPVAKDWDEDLSDTYDRIVAG